MAKSFVDASVSTEKDAMLKQDGSALALTGAARVLYDDTLSKRQLSVLINRVADKIQETHTQGASSVVAPGAPTSVVATAGDGQVGATWLAPSSVGSGPITNYRLAWSGGQTNVLGNVLTGFVAGVANGVAGTLTVAASNDGGATYGPASAPSNSVTPIAALNQIAFSHRLSAPNVPTPNASSLRFFGQRTRIGNRTDQLLNNLVFEFQNDIANSAILVNAPQMVLEVGISANSNVDNPSRSLLTFEGGGTSVTLAPGQTIKTVPRVLGTPLAFGGYVDLFMDIQYATAPSALPATNIISFNYPADSNEASATTRVNKAVTGGITTRAVARNVFGPVAAYATPAGVSNTSRVVVLGDSIVTGANDTTTGAYIACIQRALGANYPWTALSQSGYSWGLMTGANLAKTYACIEGNGAFTHALAALGTNDFAGGTGATAETIYALMVAHKAYLDAKGVKLIICTPWPRTNASNNAIPSGDNAAVWTRIQTLRDLIIANNGVGYGYFDLSLYARDAVDVNLWRTDLGSPTSDGVHPNTVIHTAVSTALAAALPALLV